MTYQSIMVDDLSTIAKADLVEFYTDYYQGLDALDLENWPSFFAQDCFYRVTGRENYERGFPLGAILAESRGMLEDRVMALRKTQEFAPRYYRRFPGPVKITNRSSSEIEVEHNLLIVQTLTDKQSNIALCARCYDELITVDKMLLIKKREVIFDSEMIQNSLIYPA